MRVSHVSAAAIAAVLTFGASSAVLAEEAAGEQPDTTPAAIDQVSRTDIVVTARSREELRETLSPGAVSVIYPDDTKGEHKALPDLLDTIPGIFVRRVNGTGQYTTTSIRGSAPSQVNIYVDGVPYNTAGEAAGDISTIPVGNIERIEVYRGLVPARFSGSPLGGAINLVTKRAKGFSGTVSGGVRSFGGWQASGNINLPLFGGSLLLGADAEGSKGDFSYTLYDFEQYKNAVASMGADGLPNTSFTRYNTSTNKRESRIEDIYPTERTRQNNSFLRYNGLARWTNDHFSAKYSFTYLRRFQPTPVGFGTGFTTDLPEYSYPGGPALIGVGTSYETLSSITNARRRQTQSQHDVALGWHEQFGELEASASLTFLDRTQAFDNIDLLTSVTSTGSLWTRFHTQRFGGQIDLAYTFGRGSPITQRLELHAQGTRETLWSDASAGVSGGVCTGPTPSPNFYCTFRRHLVNFQAQDTMTIAPLGDLQITAIGRVERLFGPVMVAGNNKAISGDGNYDWQPTWGIGAKKSFGNLIVFANTGTYNRYPNFYEIYGDGIAIAPGRDSLGKLYSNITREHGRVSEVGFGWNGQVTDSLRASLRATGFAREANDEITLYATAQGGAYMNTGSTLTRGFELEGNLVFGKFADLQFGYAYQKGRYVEGTYYWFGGTSAANRVGNNPIYRLGTPHVAANARLNLHFLGGALTTFGEVRHTGQRDWVQQVAPDGTPTFFSEEPLTTFNIGAHYKLGNGLAFSAGVTDIANAGPRQTQHQDFPTAGGAGYNNVLIKVYDRNVYSPQQGRTFYVTIAKSFGEDYTSGRGSRDAFAPSAKSWTGFYVGGAFGAGWAPVNSGERLVFDGGSSGGARLDGVYNDWVRGGLTRTGPATAAPVVTANPLADMFYRGFDGSGAALGANPDDGIRADRNQHISYGFRAGYDRQIGNWLIGAVAEWSHYGLTDYVSGFGVISQIGNATAPRWEDRTTNTASSYTFARTLDSMASLRLRGGVTWGSMLFYGTAGVARADLDEQFSTTDTLHTFTVDGARKHRWGRQLGGGIETRIFGPFTLGLEYLNTRFETEGPTVNAKGYLGFVNYGFQPSAVVTHPGTNIRRSSDVYSIHALRATVGYRF
ncbi:MAG: TonB-dependent receptor plug domain-containing protein [Novosphingobium sp.]